MSDKQGVPTLPPLSGGGNNNGGSSTNAGTQQTVNLQQVLASQGLNVLTTGGGQQFVITSQVSGLTQVIPSGTTTNAGLQQVTRIVNIGNISTASGSSLTSPSRPTTTKVVLATSPKLVRTNLGNMFLAPTSQSGSSPPVKKLKLSEAVEKSTILDDNSGYRRRIMEHKIKRMRAIREKYIENVSELFFLNAGGNMMDYQAWKKRPPTGPYLQFLNQHRLDPDDENEDLTSPLPTITEIPTTLSASTTSSTTQSTQNIEVKIAGVGVTPVAVSTTLPAAVAQLSQQGGTPIVPESPKPLVTVSTTSSASNKQALASTSLKTSLTSTSTQSASSSQPVVKLVKLPPTNSPSSCDTQNNQEQIVEKAKQEAYVMQRISELQRDGLWSEKRLPKVQEPGRTKAHWDYLLEEMVWLAADFAQERKWKKAAAKKCARMVQKHFQEKAIQAQKAEKLQELRLKKIAGFIAKEIKTFWANVEKLVEFKQQTRLEEKRKKALDQHLNFIVGQTEKYSTWLTEGLNKTDGSQSVPASINSSRLSSPVPTQKQHSDDEFEPNQSSEDDEETIAKAEEEMKSTTNHKEEVELLKKESEIPLEDLLKELPPNYLEERDKSLSPCPEDNDGDEEEEEEEENNIEGDAEFTVASDESTDDEDTIREQEEKEKNADHQKELDDLKAENEMSIDELMAKYGNMPEASMDVDEESDRESGKESEKEDEEEVEEKSESESESEDETKDDEEESQSASDGETSVGLKSLLEDLGDKSPNKNVNESHVEAHNEMDDVAALAESIQPKGNTLLTTSVVTKIPFLLKHNLREYQHIGLDWLVTMYDRKLNGILADEMGLGKTIQTIALLAHLACEKGNWGPHLIIVPTSVMLNWEMECKKWCPGFKILTYYGTQKERKQKRTGWTKPNAFHICITSYKLVIQDHQSFRRKKWKYLILDEAQNIKNFKSQRWQLLLNFQTQRRLLLTGTPLQNNLMELWSLMHFLMPNVFQSHREFKEWFSNPVTGMIEGNSEYNENIIRRLHKVLRPFLLRRLKTEVEKQLPKKYEHVHMCRLSKRQRFLYDDFMSRAKTKETLASGNLLSVINVLMQLRKVCNHPNLFEVRPTVSPFQMEGIEFITASLVWSALDYDPFKHVDLSFLNLNLADLEGSLTAFTAHRVRRLKTPRKLIEEIDSRPPSPPRCPSGKIKINVRLSNQAKAPPVVSPAQSSKLKNLTGMMPPPRSSTSSFVKPLNNQATGTGVTLRVAGGQQLQGLSVQLVQHQGNVKAIPVGTITHNSQTTTAITPTTTTVTPQKITVSNAASIRDGLQRITTQTVTVKQGDSVQRISVPGFAQLVQTSTGRHILLTSNQQTTNAVSFPMMTPSGQRLTVLSPKFTPVNKVVGNVVTTAATTVSGRPVMRVPPLSVSTVTTPGIISPQQPLRCGIVTRGGTHQKSEIVKRTRKESPKVDSYLAQLEEDRRQRRQAKLQTLVNINERRCAACPLYGEDLFTALRIEKPASGCQWHGGWLHCSNSKQTARTRKQYFSRTEALAQAIKSTEQIVEELKEIFDRFVVFVPPVRAPVPRFHVSHPPPHKLWSHQRLQMVLQCKLAPKYAIFHPVSSAMLTQFPDPRLIQYDCGKLQSLDRLLRKLKSGNHRVLIFTQMTRMLDVLEAFLNYHGHIYLRLDGTTRVDQRQILMERFNNDKRIFCFILSTRSGGVGVNLTGADTVIFYDSDWNPTMDAQAQDRCHRIGQTRDVHIYRLVSEKTVEENILKKANQKRLLGDLAIEGGNFTTAYFKSSTIQDLFNIDQTENDASARMAEVIEQNKEREKSLQKELSNLPVPISEDKAAIGALESALAAAEEDLDVQAAKTAKAEAVADLAEFDENIPLDDADREDSQISKAEQEVQNLVSQLTPVERYAMKFVEESEGAFSAAQLAAAERELEQQKKEWELDRLRALREEEERRMRMADDDEKPLTFSREDAQNQVNNTSNSKRVGNKKRQVAPSRRSSRRRSSRSARESSDSETETSTESESESQEDLDVSNDEQSSHTESQSQGEDEEEEVADSHNESSIRQRKFVKRRPGRPGRQVRVPKTKLRKNHLDLNSPRTRSRGDVKINLWTLDVSPILPVVKRNFKHLHWRKRKRESQLVESNHFKTEKKKSEMHDEEKCQEKLIDDDNSPSDNEEANKMAEDDGNTEVTNSDNLAENMSEINSVDAVSLSDESDEPERYVTYSPQIKLHPCDSPTFDASKALRIEKSENKNENQIESIPKRTRGRRGHHTKKIMSLDEQEKYENEAPIHITRSMHKYNKSTNNHSEDTENLDVNVGSPNNKLISISPTNVNESVFDVEYCIVGSKSEGREKSGNNSADDSAETNVERKVEPIILRTTRTRSYPKITISTRNRTSKLVYKSQEEEETNTANSSEEKEKTQEEVIKNDEEKVDQGVKKEERELMKEECKCIVLLEKSRVGDEMINNQDLNSKENSDVKQSKYSSIKDHEENENSSSSVTNQPIKLHLDLKKLSSTDVSSPRILTRLAKANSPFMELIPVCTDIESRKQARRMSVDGKRLRKTSGFQSEDNCESQESETEMQSTKNTEETSKVKKTIRSTSPSAVGSVNVTKSTIKINQLNEASSSRVTRSSAGINYEPTIILSKSSSSSSTERPSTRSKGTLDNGFLLPTQINRKIKSCSSPKSPDIKKSTDNIVNTFPSSQKRRPDTPMPKKLRVTRSGIESNLNSSIQKHKSRSSITLENDVNSRSRSSSPVPIENSTKRDISDTDSNGNAVGSENYSHRNDKETVSPSNVEISSEKPQRTAKVVAILTLDTHSRINHNKSASTTINTKKIDELPKKDGTFEQTYEESQGKTRSRSNSKSTTSGRISSPTDSIITVDLDSESENDVDSSQKKLRKGSKRSQRLLKSHLRHKTSEVQLEHSVDEDDDIQLGPKKSKFNSSEKYNNRQVS
ncbi:helicase domino isoform X2 [Chelonus insularis]|uniref:helicase domino isoform X2 n=1 Tax=Chelonus insularis TaxID=460826 RepID=UPI001588B415|nr:helicase domino isoform X2 [Chelonus insularis]